MTLKIPAPTLTALRDQLVQDDGNERFAYLFCNSSGDDLLAPSFEAIQDADLQVMHAGACRPKIDLEREQIVACYDADDIPVMVHSHPFSQRPGFSGIDVATMDEYRDWLTGLFPGKKFGFGVIGAAGLQTILYRPEKDGFEDLPVDVLGEWMLEQDWRCTSESDVPAVGRERYDRNIRALTDEGQARLADTHVGIVGCGGIGSLLAEELARLGVHAFTLIDPDVVEQSNLPRLYGAFDFHIGRPKVEVLEEHLWHINQELEVQSVQKPVEEASDKLLNVDVILAGVDAVSARMWLNEFAVKHLLAYIDAGVVIEKDAEAVSKMHGFVQTIVPGVTGCFDCLDRGDPDRARIEQLDEHELEEQVERGYVDETVLSPEPAVIHLNSTAGSLAVNEFVKLVTGLDDPVGFLRYEGLDYDLVRMATLPSDECPTCSKVLGRGEFTNVDDDPLEEVPV